MVNLSIPLGIETFLMTCSFLLLVTEKEGCQNDRLKSHGHLQAIFFSKRSSPVLLVQTHMLNRLTYSTLYVLQVTLIKPDT